MNLDEIICNTQQIIQSINTEKSIESKFPYILKYFSFITSSKIFNFIQSCIKNNNYKASQFSKFNVQFVDKLYCDIIRTGYFDNKSNYPILSIVEFSDYLTNIIDMYGVSVYHFEEHKTA